MRRPRSSLRVVDEAANEFGEQMSGVAHDAAERVNHAAEHLGDVASDVLARLEDWSQDTTVRVRKSVEEDPFLWLGISAAVGAFVGLAAFAYQRVSRPAPRARVRTARRRRAHA